MQDSAPRVHERISLILTRQTDTLIEHDAAGDNMKDNDIVIGNNKNCSISENELSSISRPIFSIVHTNEEIMKKPMRWTSSSPKKKWMRHYLMLGELVNIIIANFISIRSI